MLKTISRTLFSLVFPLNCELCGKLAESQESGGVCLACKNLVPLIPAPHCPGCGRTNLNENEPCGRCRDEKFHFDRAFACVFYDSGMKELLKGFKFGRKKFLSPFLTDLMVRFSEKNFQGAAWDLVVPVPMDRKKEFERGFNQSRLLSAAMAGHWAIPHAANLLGCAPSERPQAFLKKDERKLSVRGRFFVKNARNIASRHILLVDDILTTGQTASACAKALKEAGAKTVTVFALARGV